ncbi:hypothetical protein JCM10213v2_002137 [Rhodosporidiobolus nylandii]
MASLACSLFERSDGLTFAYKLLGRTQPATPLVLVHGSRRPPHSLILVFDNRGIGSSRVPKAMERERYTVHDLAEDVVELVKHLGFREVDILGFSMSTLTWRKQGGMIVQTLLVSASLPFKVRHAVLAATSAKPAHSDLLQAIPSAPSGALSLEEKIKLVTPFIHVGYDPTFLRNPQNKTLLYRRVLESVNKQQVCVIAGYDIRKRLHLIPPTLPVLVFHGTLDRSVYPSEANYILAGIKHAKFLSFEGVGHMRVFPTPICPSFRSLTACRWYDYFDTEYWTTLLNRFLNDEAVDSLLPPALPPFAKL